jgi:hypothetical protein
MWIVAHANPQQMSTRRSTIVDDCRSDVAHPGGDRSSKGHRKVSAKKIDAQINAWRRAWPEFSHSGSDAYNPHPDKLGLKTRRSIEALCEKSQSGHGPGDICPPFQANSAWWSTEPRLGRVAHGVAHRVDRIKAIGNGQVPQVAALAWNVLASSFFP